MLLHHANGQHETDDYLKNACNCVQSKPARTPYEYDDTATCSCSTFGEGACSTSSAAKSARSSSSTEFNRQFPLLTPRDNGMSTMFIGRRGDDDVGDTVE